MRITKLLTLGLLFCLAFCGELTGTYVGELQERWQFPSDHVPIGISFNKLHFVSWNVLDAKYVMNWSDAQGLGRSMILDEHVYIKGTKLTRRDCHVANLILEMINHPTHPRSLLSLQECSRPLIEELRRRLPPRYEILTGRAESVIYNKRDLELLEAKQAPGIFGDEPRNAPQDLCFRSWQGERLRVVNVHLPGDPKSKSRYEFANYLASTFDANLPMLVMGDMNFNEQEMAEALNHAFPKGSPFSIYAPYCTNIDPLSRHSKAIDHFYIYSPDRVCVRISQPEEILHGLRETIALLHKTETLCK